MPTQITVTTPDDLVPLRDLLDQILADDEIDDAEVNALSAQLAGLIEAVDEIRADDLADDEAVEAALAAVASDLAGLDERLNALESPAPDPDPDPDPNPPDPDPDPDPVPDPATHLPATLQLGISEEGSNGDSVFGPVKSYHGYWTTAHSPSLLISQVRRQVDQGQAISINLKFPDSNNWLKGAQGDYDDYFRDRFSLLAELPHHAHCPHTLKGHHEPFTSEHGQTDRDDLHPSLHAEFTARFATLAAEEGLTPDNGWLVGPNFSAFTTEHNGHAANGVIHDGDICRRDLDLGAPVDLYTDLRDAGLIHFFGINFYLGEADYPWRNRIARLDAMIEHASRRKLPPVVFEFGHKRGDQPGVIEHAIMDLRARDIRLAHYWNAKEFRVTPADPGGQELFDVASLDAS